VNRYAVGILIMFMAVIDCRVYDAAKQVRTVATMQAMCAAIEDAKERRVPISESEIRVLIAQVSKGRDGWGHPVVLAFRDSPAGPRYVLVSVGSDGRLDVVAAGQYFERPPTGDVKNDVTRDVVFIDGRQVTNAGK
jgi:hypothetical protein